MPDTLPAAEVTPPASPVTIVDVVRPTLPPEDYLREQDKPGNENPVSASVEPVKAEPLAIAMSEPYPTGSPDIPPVENVPMGAKPAGG